MENIETQIKYQLTGRDRITVLFRLILVFPVYLLLCTYSPLTHYGFEYIGVITFPVVLTLLFRNKYPSYVLTFNHGILEFMVRITAYASLLTDSYPSIERNDEFAVIFPDVENGAKLNRWLPLVKWILSIPILIVGVIYAIGGYVVWAIAFLSILFTGNLPAWAAEYLLKLIQFWNRYVGYAVVLVSDKYPSFSL